MMAAVSEMTAFVDQNDPANIAEALYQYMTYAIQSLCVLVAKALSLSLTK